MFKLIAAGMMLLNLGSVAVGAPIELRVRPTTGQTMVYRIGMEIDVTQRTDETSEPTRDRAEHEAVCTFKVESINEDQSATVSVAFDVVRMSVDGVSGSGSFVGANDASRLQALGGLEAGSSDENIKLLGEALLACSPKFRVAPDGTVTDVVGFEPFLRAYGGQETFDERVLGFFSPPKFALMVEPLFSADGAGTRTLDVGKGWQMIENVSLGGAGAFDMITSWSVSTAEGDEVVLKGSLQIDQLIPAVRDAATPQVRLTDHEGSTTAVWSTKANQLRERESRQRIATEWILGDLRLQQVQVSESNIQRIANGSE